MTVAVMEETRSPDTAYYLQCNGTNIFGDYNTELDGMALFTRLGTWFG